MTAMKRSRDEVSTTPEIVADWMLRELERQAGILNQDDAAGRIADLFGERFVYENRAGNIAIHKEVLAAFRKLTGNTVVWSSGERLWRRRESGDELSRKQH